MISASMWDMWEEVSEIVKIEDNFGVLRSVLKSTPLPAIPYLGMFVFIYFILFYFIFCFYLLYYFIYYF